MTPVPPVHVLLVDDDEEQLEILSWQLQGQRSRPFQIAWARDYAEGLRELATGSHEVALIDYRLGPHSGLDLIRTATAGGIDVPLIVLTGQGDDSIDDDALAAGAVDYLDKADVNGPLLGRTLRYAVERHQAVVRLRQREESLRLLLADAADAILLVNRDGAVQFVSGACEHGPTGCPTVGSHVLDLVSDVDRHALASAFACCLRTPGSRYSLEARADDGTGTWRHLDVSLSNHLERQGVSAIVLTYRDVTDRRAAEAHQALLASIVSGSQDAIFSATIDGTVVSWNGGAEQLYGYAAEEMIGRHVSLLLRPDDRSELDRILGGVRAGHGVRQQLVTRVTKNGALINVSLTVSPLRSVSGEVIGASAIARDVTERQKMLAALAESEALYRTTFAEAPVGIVHTDPDGRCLRINGHFCELLGRSAQELLGTDFRAVMHPDDIQIGRQKRREVQEGSRPHARLEERYKHKDGHDVWANATFTVHREPDGAPRYGISVVEDISDRQKAQQELDQFFQLVPDMLCTANYEGYYTRVNASWTKVLGYTSDELCGQPLLSFVHPEDRQKTERELARLADGQTTFGFTNRYRSADGLYHTIEWHARADVAQRVIYAAARDLTDRQAFEERLRQAQKMEAVGRLAGGVAHDFNNVLTTILGFTELTLECGTVDEAQWRANLQEVARASQSAAGLTRQLLAFSRRQVLAPKVVDLGAVVQQLSTMLRRLIGEDIQFVIRTAPDLRPVSADPGQVEQVVMNLAVNARDAMPKGGHLSIEVANADLDDVYAQEHPGTRPGRYVVLTVSDSGVGMDEAVRARLFEPFFTTKEPGKGTGLGLATVYGIVKQSGGSIWVYSEPGAGAAFKIYLPSAEGLISESTGVVPQAAVGGTETIFIVEDQDEVRRIARRILEANGYTILEADRGEAALVRLTQHHLTVDLLLTDVVLPGISGNQLAQEVRRARPELPVLYMSGHTEDAIVRHGLLAPGIDLVEKPFTAGQLLSKVRQVLNRGAGERA